jgi:hypothetical protein
VKQNISAIQKILCLKTLSMTTETEQTGSNGNAFGLHLGGILFESGLGHRLFLTGDIRSFKSVERSAGMVGHDTFHMLLVHLIIH